MNKYDEPIFLKQPSFEEIEIKKEAEKHNVVTVENNVVIPTNRHQTPITRQLLDDMNNYVREEFLNMIQNVDFVKWMIDPNRPYAKDLQRDEKGRVIVDICKPHLLSNMDFFTQTIDFFKENEAYTLLRPNANKASQFYRWITRERDRIWYGMTRKSDGEWIPGYMYFLLNYSPIMINVLLDEKKKVKIRKPGWSNVWDGIYLRQHYIWQSRFGGKYDNFVGGKHSLELAKRGAGKAIWYGEKVYTPDGWKKWEDINVGSALFGDDGKPTKVTCIPYDDICHIYNVQLEDGRTLKVSSGHLFKVKRGHSLRSTIMSTEEIMDDCDKVQYHFPAFRKKVGGYKFKERYYKLISIQYIGLDKAKCVTVDNKSHCFVAGDMVISHNSFGMASMMARNILFGENSDSYTNLFTILTAQEKEYLTDKDGTVTKFIPILDHCAKYTQFPRQRLVDSMSRMVWKMGYKDIETNIVKGTGNTVAAVSSKDNSDKLRGKRGTIMFEEIGNFKGLREIWNTVRESVEEGNYAFAQLYGIGTSGNKESDFSSVKELLCHPEGYNIYALPNVWDYRGQGSKTFSYFYPAYLNRDGCYDKDGNSDVVKALVELIKGFDETKHSVSSLETIIQRRAEQPLRPADALLRVKFNIFPTALINERLLHIQANPDLIDGIHVGKLLIDEQGKVFFTPTDDVPIREFPLDTNKVEGALEIYEHPQKDRNGNVFENRYIVANDPIDTDDATSTLSLSSNLVLDLWTDRIVAEDTGRSDFADDNYERTRRLVLYYNAKLLYENNIKGTYSYFAKMNSLYLLEDTPAYLRERGFVKMNKYGNASKGVSTFGNTKGHADILIRNWLKIPKVIIAKVDGKDTEVTVTNTYFIMNIALLKEMAAYNPLINVDRIRAMGILMIYREQKMIECGGNIEQLQNDKKEHSEIMSDPLIAKFNKYISSSRFVNQAARLESLGIETDYRNS